MTQWMPLGLLALHLFVSTGRRRYAGCTCTHRRAHSFTRRFTTPSSSRDAQLSSRSDCSGFIGSIHPQARAVFGDCSGGAGSGDGSAHRARAFAAAEPIEGERGRFGSRRLQCAALDYLRASKQQCCGASGCSHPRRSERCSQAPPTDARRRAGPAPPFGACGGSYGAGPARVVGRLAGLNGARIHFLPQWLNPDPRHIAHPRDLLRSSTHAVDSRGLRRARVLEWR